MFKVDKAMSRSNIPRTIRFIEEHAVCNYDNGEVSDELKDDN